MGDFYIEGLTGIYIGQRIDFEEELILGRDANACQLIYPSSEIIVSGVHCKLTNINGKILLTDMGSTNGTFLNNGIRLSPYQEQPLQAGDGFYLGDPGNQFILKSDEMPVYAEQTQGGVLERSPAERKGIGISITAIVMGILTIVLSLLALTIKPIGYAALITGIIGIIMGMYSLICKYRGRAMALAGLICSVVSIGVMAAYILFNPADTLAGSWKIVNGSIEKGLAQGLSDELSQKGLGKESGIAKGIVDSCGLTDECMITFTESGSVCFNTAEGMTVSFGSVTWEDMGDNRIQIVFDLSDLKVFGSSLPVKIGYLSAYELKKNNLTLDLFGCEIELERAE